MTDRASIEVDIISDVMCPWCVVGYLQLAGALREMGVSARLRWLPFELNPDMAQDGEPLTTHIMRKYGITEAESAANRDRLRQIGQSLGFAFNFDPSSRIWNSFAAHQLLEFALTIGKQHPLKLALFRAHFSEGRNMSDQAVLLDLAEEVGIERSGAEKALEDGKYADSVREMRSLWQSQGVSGVPTMIFANKFILSGAQGAETYKRVISQSLAVTA